ncbi:replication initiation factor domain-containing protein [Luteimonas suaedae]|uniref:replication initiation factor domain-containing protein n=1 Tax=Luteimonas suaedae TaxID=2605430 RepID=UPI0011ECACF6|nr:replication initiation factor domain-containing protein [Luteimonas suaedae]
MAADGTFSPVPTGEKSPEGAIGPRSNTGQKGGAGALIDYCTVVLPESSIEDHGVTWLPNLIGQLFGTNGAIVVGSIRNKPWQFYSQSAVLLDREGEMVGRVGLGGNGSTICVSLSGAGCRWVTRWDNVAKAVERWRGKLSRVDVAYDDYDGECLDVHALRERAAQGDFASGGRPPMHRFLSDEGHGTGCTLYVGAKGHKELCVYEKGKQLGLKTSPWVRAEVRMYGKHTALPLDVLTRPLDYLRGAYSVLQEIITGFCTRIRTTRKAVEATGTAMVEWMHRQVGPAINLLREAFGASWADFAEVHIAREGHPGRFRGVAKGDRLAQLMREELCPS